MRKHQAERILMNIASVFAYTVCNRSSAFCSFRITYAEPGEAASWNPNLIELKYALSVIRLKN